MSVFGGPNIIEDGLVLCLDAGNTKSYPGTGTTWTDLSRAGNNASAYGSPVFSTDGKGCFDFATATGNHSNSASMGWTFSSNMIPTTGNFTFECWVKNPPASGNNQPGLFANAPSADGYRFGPSLDGVYYLIAGTYTEATIPWPGGNLNSSLWYHIVATWDRASAKRVNTYLNGVYQNFGTMPSTQTAFTARTPGIVRSACCTVYTGKLAAFNAYNRLLTASEILQNFNATRGRYNI